MQGREFFKGVGPEYEYSGQIKTPTARIYYSFGCQREHA